MTPILRAGILALLLVAIDGCGGSPGSTGGDDAALDGSSVGLDGGALRPDASASVDAATAADAALRVDAAVAADAATPTGPAIPAPPAGTAYWGAWINGDQDSATEEQQTQAFEALAGRGLALHMHYYGWTSAFASSADMQADLAHHRTPVVTWSCGPDNAAVSSGSADAVLAAATASVKKFGAPMFIRWNWEMNLTGGNKCMGADGAAGFIAAWRYIHDYFKSAGVTNVAWLWNPARSSTDGKDAAQYWPGAKYVDWIGFDGYDKSDFADTDAAHAFSDVFQPFYDFYTTSTYFKNGAPMSVLIAETGECQASASSPAIQQNYVAEVVSDLAAGKFPKVGGFMYFDAPGSYASCPYAPQGGWIFDAFGGRTAFITMGQSAAFAATVPGS